MKVRFPQKLGVGSHTDVNVTIKMYGAAEAVMERDKLKSLKPC